MGVGQGMVERMRGAALELGARLVETKVAGGEEDGDEGREDADGGRHREGDLPHTRRSGVSG